MSEERKDPTVIVNLRKERETRASVIPPALERFKESARRVEVESSNLKRLARKERAESRNRVMVRAAQSGEIPPDWSEEITGQIGVVSKR